MDAYDTLKLVALHFKFALRQSHFLLLNSDAIPLLIPCIAMYLFTKRKYIHNICQKYA